jgi:rubredoxin
MMNGCKLILQWLTLLLFTLNSTLASDAFNCITNRITIKDKTVSNTFGTDFSDDVGFQTWMCLICGWIYDEATGIPDEGILPGTRWKDVPINWTCPECGARKEDFEMIAI